MSEDREPYSGPRSKRPICSPMPPEVEKVALRYGDEAIRNMEKLMDEILAAGGDLNDALSAVAGVQAAIADMHIEKLRERAAELSPVAARVPPQEFLGIIFGQVAMLVWLRRIGR